MISTRRAVILLDMVLLLMTGGWVLFGLSKGIDSVELIYNYIYVFIALITMVLNIKLLQQA